MAGPLFKKILIANRGEIAVRVIRACRELNIKTVAVYSEVDKSALHVRFADEAYPVGAPESKNSYLVQEKILNVARQSGAAAIHPGYGFLAENPTFAQRVLDGGFVFIGPGPHAMQLMGDKTAARKKMQQSGVPVVPGTDAALNNETEAIKIANQFGYPVLLKAAAGGGGKGMRIVKQESEMASAFRAASSEAGSAFGDNRIYIEKYLAWPRHIEFQILADKFGSIVHLGERECSIQRRHQKIIEEAPSCVLDENLREKMGEAAVNAAKACGYENAGTIEFMLDQNKKFFFLEMNTRLQVEHPVTEMITGMDLVKEQIRIAAGEKLGYEQRDIRFSGHAVECRIYAEDFENNFLPSTGRINFMSLPAGPGIRNDSGYYEGSEVTVYYDPLISKLVAWGKDREEAIARMKRALREYLIAGVETSIPFCHIVMSHVKFIAGDFNTHFIEDEVLNNEHLVSQHKVDPEIPVLGATLYFHNYKTTKIKLNNDKAGAGNNKSNWKTSGRQRNLH